MRPIDEGPACGRDDILRGKVMAVVKEAASQVFYNCKVLSI